MATVYALLAAINNYPNPQHQLNGCLNDLDGMRAFLEDYCRNHNLTLKAVVLKDKDATRDNIIEGFEHQAQAGEGDHCLFFFSGHGSRCRAPKEFWHLEPDKMNESLVCWDSRTREGRDLIDKEMSYLIWKVTYGKDISFISITDCCHSGTNMRLEPVGERRVSKVNTAIPIEEYLGFEHYERVGEGQYTPPRGRYIHLAACQPHETAKEAKIKDQKRGIFSYLLQDVLAGSRSPLSYAELLARARARVRHYMKDQYPMLETSHSGDQNRFFLSNQEQDAAPYLVSHHRNKGWIINAGSLHNMIAGSGAVTTTFELLEDGRKIELVQVFADYSTVSGMEGANAGEVHPARLVSQALPRLPLAPAADSDPEGMKIFEELLQAQSFGPVEWAEDPEEARFLVHAKGGSYYLTSPQDERPLFRRVEGFHARAAKEFMHKLETVARWIRLQELSHPNSRIPLSRIEIGLYKGTDPGNFEDDAPADPVDWREPGLFSYEYPNGKVAMPTFKLRITNKSDSPLWASVLYLGADYSIDDVLMPVKRLNPKAEAWCSYLKNMHANRTVPVVLNDIFHQWGLTRSYNYLKIILCTAEFDTNGFNQQGLKLEHYWEDEGQERNLGFEENIPEEDWAILTIPITIYRPLDAQPLNALNAGSFFGHRIQAPKGFAANVRLATLEDACRGLPAFPELEAAPGRFLYPAELGPSASRPGLSVLELLDCKGAEAVSADRPLRLQWRKGGGATPAFTVYGLDEESLGFYPLRSRWEGRELFIEELPEGEEEGVRIFCFDRR